MEKDKIELYERLKATLNWYDIEIVEEINESEPSDDEELRTFLCKKDGEEAPILADLYDDESVDIYYKNSEDSIFQGELINIQKESPLDKIVEQYENSLEKDTSSSEQVEAQDQNDERNCANGKEQFITIIDRDELNDIQKELLDIITDDDNFNNYFEHYDENGSFVNGYNIVKNENKIAEFEDFKVGVDDYEMPIEAVYRDSLLDGYSIFTSDGYFPESMECKYLTQEEQKTTQKESETQKQKTNRQR